MGDVTRQPRQHTAPMLFLSVDNMKLCLDVLRTYMVDEFAFDVMRVDPQNKKFMYEIMKGVSSEAAQDAPIRELNNMVLNACRDHYRTKYRLARKGKATHAPAPSSVEPPPGSTQTALDREAMLFGSRPINAHMSSAGRGDLSTRSSGSSTSIEQDFKNLENERRHSASSEAARNVPKFDDISKPITENAFDPQEFNRKISALRNMRDLVDGGSDRSIAPPQETRMTQDVETHRANSIENSDPKQLFATLQAEKDAATNAVLANTEAAAAVVTDQLQRKVFVTPPPAATHLVESYLVINGFDRDWNKHRMRYNVVADFNSFAENDLHARYRNIRSICMKRAIIPQEITDAPSLGNMTKPVYNYPFSFCVPYVLICIDEVDNVLDGTNDAVRRSFCQMIVDKHYRAPNGRGFFVLQSLQDEKKTYYPTPLSALSRLSITVRKPNGDIFNASRDDYSVDKIEHDGLNPQYLRVVVDKYFDKNEFFKGDTVRVRNFSPLPTTDAVATALGRVVDFVNRGSGHDVMEMGQPNANGYFKTFFIRAPGDFDAAAGRFRTDQDAIDALMHANDILVNEPCAPTGELMNMTLQCVFSLKVEQIASDPGVQDTIVDV